MESHVHKWVPMDQSPISFPDMILFGFTAAFLDVCVRCGIVRVKEEFMPREVGAGFTEYRKEENEQKTK